MFKKFSGKIIVANILCGLMFMSNCPVSYAVDDLQDLYFETCSHLGDGDVAEGQTEFLVFFIRSFLSNSFYFKKVEKLNLINGKSANLDLLNKLINFAEESLTGLFGSLNDLEAQKVSLLEKLESNSIENANLLEQLNFSKTENENLRSQLESSNIETSKQFEELKNRNESLRSQLESSKGKSLELENSESIDKIDEEASGFTEKLKINEETSKQIEELENKNADLQNQLDSINEKISKYKELETENSHFKNQLEEMKRKNKGLENQLESIKEENMQRIQEIELKSSAFENQLEEMKQRDKGSNDQLELENSDLERKLEDLNAQLVGAEKAKNSTDPVNEQNVEHYNRLLKILSGVPADTSIGIETVDGLIKNIELDKNPLSSSVASILNRICTTLCGGYESRIKNYESRINNYETRINNYETRINNGWNGYKPKIKQLKTNIENLHRENAHLLLAFNSQFERRISFLKDFYSR